tara:strand:+ start:1349 stop:1831 length:483 start_codon:yes stop_codon:yes gene_type:complete
MDKIRRRIYTLEIEEVIEKDHWIGIHTSLEPFQLAFIINQNSRLKLSRSKKDIFSEKKQGVFEFFEWVDPIKDIVCNLLSNRFVIEKNKKKLNNDVLFKLPERNELYLIDEFKRVDLLFRSSNEKIIKSIKHLLIEEPMTSLVYSIPEEKIRNQLNLIFQ